MDKDVRVTDISVHKLPVSLKKTGKERKPRLHVGETKLGMPYERADYPEEVTVVVFTTSEDKTYKVASHTLPYFNWDSYYSNWEGRTVWKRIGKRTFKRRVKIDGISLSYDVVSKLKKGMRIRTEQPFRMINRKLTNGKISFPLSRPMGQDWQYYREINFAQGVNRKNWRLFLTAIHGLYFDQELPTMTSVRKMKKRKEMRKISTEYKRKQKKGEVFTHPDSQLVAIGSNLLFTACGDATCSDDKKMYVVDSPQYGRGLYIFDDYQPAFDWATRNINFRKARELALAFFPHVGDWKNRVATTLA
ncbi:hypothetical protein ACFL2U_01330 [Patescibacteria group bacterium]